MWGLMGAPVYEVLHRGCWPSAMQQFCPGNYLSKTTCGGSWGPQSMTFYTGDAGPLSLRGFVQEITCSPLQVSIDFRTIYNRAECQWKYGMYMYVLGGGLLLQSEIKNSNSKGGGRTV